MSLSSNNPT